MSAWIPTISDEATSDSELSSMLLRAARGDTNLILMGVASAVPLTLARSHTIVSVQLSRLGGWPCSRQHRAARVQHAHARRHREGSTPVSNCGLVSK